MSRVLNSKFAEQEKNNDFFALNESKKRSSKLSLKEVESTLKEWRISYIVKNSNHIKIGLVNFYLSTGTCYVDGMGASFKKKGLNFLKDVLKKEGIL